MPAPPAPHFTHLLFIHAPTSSPNSLPEQMVSSYAYEEDQLFRLAESRLTTEDQKRLAVEMMKIHNRLSAT
jgi:hypothetical protein